MINQTRKWCALYMGKFHFYSLITFKSNHGLQLASILVGWDSGVVGGPSWSNADFVQWVAARNVACVAVYSARPCSCNPSFWEPLR